MELLRPLSYRDILRQVHVFLAQFFPYLLLHLSMVIKLVLKLTVCGCIFDIKMSSQYIWLPRGHSFSAHLNKCENDSGV